MVKYRRMNVVIMGAGSIGMAIGAILKEKRGIKISFWDVMPGKVKKQEPLPDLLGTADVVFLCMPTFALREAAKTLRPSLKRRTIVVSLAKGIESDTDFSADRLLSKILPWRQPFVLLFGPMLASELENQACGHAVVSSFSRPAVFKIATLFSGTRLRVVKNYDVRGVALCGALKNVYAIGMGVISALEAGDNIRGAYVAAAVLEMQYVVRRLGGNAETVMGYAGLADLVATGLNGNSRNYQIGCALGGRGRCRGSEGSRAAVSFANLLGKDIKHLPLMRTLHRLLDSGADPEELLAAVCAS